MFAIKAEVIDPGAEAFAFGEQKTMYGGKHSLLALALGGPAVPLTRQVIPAS